MSFLNELKKLASPLEADSDYAKSVMPEKESKHNDRFPSGKRKVTIPKFTEPNNEDGLIHVEHGKVSIPKSIYQLLGEDQKQPKQVPRKVDIPELNETAGSASSSDIRAKINSLNPDLKVEEDFDRQYAEVINNGLKLAKIDSIPNVERKNRYDLPIDDELDKEFYEVYQEILKEKEEKTAKASAEVQPKSSDEKCNVTYNDILKENKGKQKAPEKVSLTESRYSAEEKIVYIYPLWDWRLPPLRKEESIYDTEKTASKEELENVIGSFNAEGKVISITSSPSVDRFEVELDEACPKLQEELQSWYCSNYFKNIRFVSNSPEHFFVEIPKIYRSWESLNDYYFDDLGNEHGLKSSYITLGTCSDGTRCKEDIFQLSNILIAGGASSGKTSLIQSILISLLYNLPPEKMGLEYADSNNFSVCSELPHKINILTYEYSLMSTLKEEYQYRSDLFEKEFISDIDILNAVRHARGENQMAHILAVIDDYDKFIKKIDFEDKQKLTQIIVNGAPYGIHFIISTKSLRPEIISPTVKSFFPLRIALKTRNAEESKEIIGESGAELLLGQGDMLVLKKEHEKNNKISLRRVQAPCPEDFDSVISSIIDVNYDYRKRRKSKQNSERML